jgi:hypothetical protein
MTTLHLEPIARPSNAVREIKTQDGAALLDIQQGLCLSLNPVASEIWNLLMQSLCPDQIIEHIATKFAVPREEVARDVKDFVEVLSQRALLTTRQGERPKLGWAIALFHHCHTMLQGLMRRNDHMIVLTSKALFALLAFDLLRMSTTFATMYEFVRGWTTAPRSPNDSVIERVSNAIDYACVCYPKTVLCLQRSAVMTCMLRSCGIPAQMVLGAQQVPFVAHAWCEVAGRPTGERVDVKSLYKVWDGC